jgi:hypothetical protein
MGASGWWYRCEYDPDASAALNALQTRVFEAGDHSRPWDEIPDIRPATVEHLQMFFEMAPEMLEQSGLDETTLERLANGDPPSSIDEARLWVAEDGTHSILDYQVADEPTFGAVTPLDDSTTASLFGSARPSAAAIEAAKDPACAQVRERWTGYYAVAYDSDGDKPTDLFFWLSGD